MIDTYPASHTRCRKLSNNGIHKSMRGNVHRGNETENGGRAGEVFENVDKYRENVQKDAKICWYCALVKLHLPGPFFGSPYLFQIDQLNDDFWTTANRHYTLSCLLHSTISKVTLGSRQFITLLLAFTKESLRILDLLPSCPFWWKLSPDPLPQRGDGPRIDTRQQIFSSP